MESPYDPASSVKVENGRIVELDGKSRAEFDMIDRLLPTTRLTWLKLNGNAARRAGDRQNAGGYPRQPGRDHCHYHRHHPGESGGGDGANERGGNDDGAAKNARQTHASNQCHVTNLKDNPVQIAADAAEAGIRGFSEQETTVGIARYAPFNALALLVGSQCGRPGVLTQCSVEEATELELGMRGLTSYAETVSVYGTESVFTDGDDTPWSKRFSPRPMRLAG
jgi:glycerol dehydratase large subunit